MIRCKKCGEQNTHLDLYCKKCNEKQSLTEMEIGKIIGEAELCLRQNNYIRAIDCYKLLASVGDPTGERELGLILERGILLPRDYEAAVQYYSSAAKKGDPISAYKHSRTLVGNERLSDFYLAYSAIMGCREAYPETYMLYAKYKERGIAAYYCHQLAEEGDVDAIIEMARRHLYGDGVKQSEKMAKAYIERLERPPLHALKLYRRISSVEGRSLPPDTPEFTERKRVISRLIEAADKFKLYKILHILSELYAEEGGKDAPVYLAMLQIRGIETDENIDGGIAMLAGAAEAGSTIAARMLGDIYREGKYAERDLTAAESYYRRAAELSGGEYEVLGDVFLSGEVSEPDYALALSLYEAGALMGDGGCQRKLRKMHQTREGDYITATQLERTDPDRAFVLYKKSVESGYLPAHARIGWYYERGIGTEVDRKRAFLHYKAAYEAGDKRAVESLGRCYARGIGTAFDFKRASELLSVAREMGSRSADKELYRIYENKKKHMIRSLYSTATRLYYQGKYDIARGMLETCMQLGLGEATYSIGCLWEFGITTAPDRKTALRFYKMAADQGYTDPRQYHKQSMLRIWKQK